MSDLHGCFDKFIEMIKLINFNEKDELYILGDVFDRGPNPLQIIDYIVAHKNITLIKGNHEQMYQDFFEGGDSNLWFGNGGYKTYSQIIKKGLDFDKILYEYIKKLPLIIKLDKFILIHADLYYPEQYIKLSVEELIKEQTENDLLWNRSNIDNEKQYRDYITIGGHTPVQSIINIKEPTILKREGHIYIDCGCCFKGGRLACLRLEDMKEFYISA